MLNIPPDSISEVYEKAYEAGEEFYVYGDELQIAVEEWGEGVISEETMSDYSGALYTNMIGGLYATSVLYDFTISTQSISVTKSGENNFTYEAVVNTDIIDEQCTIKGSIQFNDDFLVTYMTCDLP